MGQCCSCKKKSNYASYKKELGAPLLRKLKDDLGEGSCDLYAVTSLIETKCFRRIQSNHCQSDISLWHSGGRWI